MISQEETALPRAGKALWIGLAALCLLCNGMSRPVADFLDSVGIGQSA